jgi:hypothetical protein
MQRDRCRIPEPNPDDLWPIAHRLPPDRKVAVLRDNDRTCRDSVSPQSFVGCRGHADIDHVLRFVPEQDQTLRELWRQLGVNEEPQGLRRMHDAVVHGLRRVLQTSHDVFTLKIRII